MADWITEHAPTIGLVFFFTVFVVICIMVMRPGAKKELEEHKYIPLNGDKKHGK